MKKYICTVCDYVYDPVQGDPDAGIEPGTAFEDCLMIGSVPCVGSVKMNSNPMKNNFGL